ncbi:MAG: type 2 isopentenyl-diphosphate Delta-isomerase [Proteobacteria bacterium]|nr:type 2 isopentenyl-diphosphate Delta-isomerase [Pseudomonadota bacterium]
MASISQRKADHIEVAASGEADFRHRSTLLEEVHLVHQALPELAVAEIELSTEIAGMRLAAPLVVSGMTGGTAEAGQINRDLARAAETVGLAFGVGSQRAMAQDPDLESTFQVRDVAPGVALIGNLGVVQARAMGTVKVAELARRIGANAMAIHLNPAMELIQQDGDRDFRGALDTIARLVDALPVPVIAKETGCGLSAQAARSLAGIGVHAVDVSGAGGTSWVAVEARRAPDNSPARRLGEELWDWGIPTAVSVAACAAHDLPIIATGGLRSGLDVCRAIALGATAGGLAAPVLRAQRDHGFDGVLTYLRELVHSVRTVTLLCGCRRVGELGKTPRHIGLRLRTWLDDLGIR